MNSHVIPIISNEISAFLPNHQSSAVLTHCPRVFSSQCGTDPQWMVAKGWEWICYRWIVHGKSLWFMDHETENSLPSEAPVRKVGFQPSKVVQDFFPYTVWCNKQLWVSFWMDNSTQQCERKRVSLCKIVSENSLKKSGSQCKTSTFCHFGPF